MNAINLTTFKIEVIKSIIQDYIQLVMMLPKMIRNKTNYGKDDFIKVLKSEPIKFTFLISIISIIPSIKKSILKINGNYIQCFKMQTEEMIFLAITSQIPSSLKYIKNPSREIEDMALFNDTNQLRWIKKPTINQIIYAVMINGTSLKYISEQSEYIQKLAIDQNVESVEFLKQPSKPLLIYIISILKKLPQNKRHEIIDYLIFNHYIDLSTDMLTEINDLISYDWVILHNNQRSTIKEYIQYRIKLGNNND